MTDDLDDTVVVTPRSTGRASEPDLGDTIVASRRRPAPRERATLPASPTQAAPPPQRAATQARIMPPGVRIGASGDFIPLDVPCYIGRRPRLPRIETGVTPRLVTVASSSGEISATHLEVRQQGTAIVVTDLKSTNGTVVRLPGHVARTLRQGESVVVAPGTEVDLGDDIVIHVVGAGVHAATQTQTQAEEAS